MRAATKRKEKGNDYKDINNDNNEQEPEQNLEEEEEELEKDTGGKRRRVCEDNTVKTDSESVNADDASENLGESFPLYMPIKSP